MIYDYVNNADCNKQKDARVSKISQFKYSKI